MDSDVRALVAEVDRRLKDEGQQPVDLSDPDWMNKLRAWQPPADGVAALSALLDAYRSGSDQTRAEVRDLLRAHPSFRNRIHLPRDWTTEAEFRRRLLAVSAADQGNDARDVMLSLRDLVARAAALGIDPAPALRDAAALSSDVDHYGMGSMRQLLAGCLPAGNQGNSAS
ncbi:hypothetical protein [Paractinoplanes rishiriensis]|uniref:Uncharacterized protein n=1 Tax=Paractinoplanes rishiriensis TaxID=1050105 RepID=A0A919K258_9ACTN|nr:hypothetical protein [Actinoplanes rishiriensis]GIE97263.1 hypothetical protein Ari01nite_47280 [Actinoplanes rishiriensis]